MKVGITGASGFIGRRLVAKLLQGGHEAIAFSRNPSQRVPGCAETRTAAPERELDVTRLDEVVNLAGETIMGRWTAAKKRRVLESRVQMTTRIANAMTRAAESGGPRALVNASAIGYYGDGGDAQMNEQSPVGAGFLAEVAQQWEAAALPVEAAGIRLAKVRIGLVLGLDGGAFPLLRRVFGLGLGGRLGNGQQWMSLVHVDDVAGLIVWLLEHPEASGAFNAASLTPVRNAEFTREVARSVKRPAVFPAPEFALRLALGEMSHLLLDSQRVLPTRALEAGYRFHFPDLANILDDLNPAPSIRG